MPRIAPLARLLRPTALPSLSSIALPLNSIRAIPRTITITPTLARPLSLLSLSRPSILASQSLPSILGTLSQIVPSQIRTLAYGAMYQPSQRKRKRKHGFLSRSKGGKLGRKTLANRRIQGRRFLSH